MYAYIYPLQILTRMYPGMSLKIKRVVEPLPAERAEVPLHLAVAFQMAVQQPVQRKLLLTELADKLRFMGALWKIWRKFFITYNFR